MGDRKYRFVGKDDLGDKPWETTRTSEEFRRDMRRARGEDKPKIDKPKTQRPKSGSAEDLEQRNKTIAKHVGGWSKKNQNEDEDED
jgi:hypothetical protein